jgi:hypothetical protein
MNYTPHQQHQGSQAPPLAGFDWRGALASVVLLALVIAIGPLTLALAWLIRAWCVRSRLDAADRWDSIRTFAWLFGALTAFAILAFFVFPGPALQAWTHSPFFHLGAPNLLNNTLIRWTLSLPLACALALVVEAGDRRTIRRFRHVMTVAERQEAERRRAQQMAQQKQAEERERAARLAKMNAPAAKAKTTGATLTASASPPQVKSTPRPASPTAPLPDATTHKLESDKPTLWDELPDSHPWRQEAKRTQPPAEQTPPAKKEKPKPPDLGDGSMDALL